MSSRSDNLSCSVCHEIFTEPVVLSCGHSFCRTCLQGWWRVKTTLECPFCKRKSKSDPPRNLALKNLCEAFLQEEKQKASAAGSQHLCSLHWEKLKIFCLDHQEPVCLVCRDSRAHVNHRFRPVDEAAQDHREELQKSLKPLQEKLTLLQQFKGDCDQTVKFIRVQAQETEQQIREQIQKRRLFLQQEETDRVAALRTEEEQKEKMMKEKIEAVSTDIAALSVTVRAAEKELRAEDVSFLQNYKTAVRRVQQHHIQDDPEPEPISGALIDVDKHLGQFGHADFEGLQATNSGASARTPSSTSSPTEFTFKQPVRFWDFDNCLVRNTGAAVQTSRPVDQVESKGGGFKFREARSFEDPNSNSSGFTLGARPATSGGFKFREARSFEAPNSNSSGFTFGARPDRDTSLTIPSWLRKINEKQMQESKNSK